MTEKSVAVYSRSLLKLSGEVLGRKGRRGIDLDRVEAVAADIKAVRDEIEVQMAVMIGGGNLFRGREVGDRVLKTPARVHFIGMLATMMNALALKTGFEEAGVETRVVTRLRADEVAEPFLVEKAIAHLEKGLLVILAGGSGIPFFTTDTAAANMAATLGSKVLLKGTNVDGVYDCDPKVNSGAVMYKQISLEQAIILNLTVMDRSAFDLCSTNRIPVVVFNNRQLRRNLRGVLLGHNIGTLVTND